MVHVPTSLVESGSSMIPIFSIINPSGLGVTTCDHIWGNRLVCKKNKILFYCFVTFYVK